jgi:hypothetical protein
MRITFRPPPWDSEDEETLGRERVILWDGPSVEVYDQRTINLPCLCCLCLLIDSDCGRRPSAFLVATSLLAVVD